MDNSFATAKHLIEKYNQMYNTNFVCEPKWRLRPDENGEWEFKDEVWPGIHKAGVYLFLSQDDRVIYVGQGISLSRRFYDRFRNENGIGVHKNDSWSEPIYSIVAIVAPDERKYERLSLEEFLIGELQPIDNTRGK